MYFQIWYNYGNNSRPDFIGRSRDTIGEEMEEDLKVLMEKTAKGDEQAFAELAERMIPKLKTIAFVITGSTADMEDVVQETLLTVMLKIGRYRYQKNPSAWICRIARNKAFDVVRHRRNLEYPLEIEDVQSVFHFERLEDAELLHRLATLLTAEEKNLIVLRYWAGMTMRELARSINKPLITTERKLNRVLEKIRAFVNA